MDEMCSDRDMKTIWILLIVLFGASAVILNADTAPRVAIPEFDNSSGKLVQINRWDLSVWMEKSWKRRINIKLSIVKQ